MVKKQQSEIQAVQELPAVHIHGRSLASGGERRRAGKHALPPTAPSVGAGTEFLIPRHD